MSHTRSKPTDLGPRPPPPRAQSVRAALLDALHAAGETGGAATARELSASVGIPERDVPRHLEHVARSLKAQGERLDVIPAECLACGFVFADRERLTPPGACPSCRATRIAPPRFRVVAQGGRITNREQSERDPAGPPRQGERDHES